MEWCRKKKQMTPFLVDNKELGREFRDRFLSGLTKLVEQGKLQLDQAGWIADLIGELGMKNWVAFIEGPPKPETPPSQMLKYLTRYLTGGPISDRRIIGEKDGRIFFLARSKTKGASQTIASLPKIEFVQQWSLHILPKDFTKTRHFGTWSGSLRSKYMNTCNELAPEQLNAKIDKVTTSQLRPSLKSTCSCKHCGSEMQCLVHEKRPRWRDLFYGPDHPSWFEWTSRGLCPPPDHLDDIEKAEKQDASVEEPDIIDLVITGKLE